MQIPQTKFASKIKVLSNKIVDDHMNWVTDKDVEKDTKKGKLKIILKKKWFLGLLFHGTFQ